MYQPNAEIPEKVVTSSDRSPIAFQDQSVDDMRAEPCDLDNWLWHGYLMPGQITLLTAMWKTGKTTLLAGLLAKMKSGGEYCGRYVKPGRALVVTEESKKKWLQRAVQLDLSPQVRFLCEPFKGRPTPRAWEALLDHMEAMHCQCHLDLVVIDTLASFMPYRGENSPANVVDFLLSLRRLTSLGLSVLLKHHPRKHESTIGSNARGSGALPAAVDINLEMFRFNAFDSVDRRRVILALSRHDETPVRLVVEHNEERNEYFMSAEQTADQFKGGWPILRVVLEDAWQKMSRHQILESWPEDFPRPKPSSLWFWLDRAVKDGLVLRDGLGRRNHPFRYWLPGAEDRWLDRGIYLPDIEPLDPLPEDAEETAKQLAESARLFFGGSAGK